MVHLNASLRSSKGLPPPYPTGNFCPRLYFESCEDLRLLIGVKSHVGQALRRWSGRRHSFFRDLTQFLIIFC